MRPRRPTGPPRPAARRGLHPRPRLPTETRQLRPQRRPPGDVAPRRRRFHPGHPPPPSTMRREYPSLPAETRPFGQQERPRRPSALNRARVHGGRGGPPLARSGAQVATMGSASSVVRCVSGLLVAGRAGNVAHGPADREQRACADPGLAPLAKPPRPTTTYHGWWADDRPPAT